VKSALLFFQHDQPVVAVYIYSVTATVALYTVYVEFYKPRWSNEVNISLLTVIESDEDRYMAVWNNQDNWFNWL